MRRPSFRTWMPRGLRSVLSVPNILATVAVFAALSGTAFAAMTVTGKQFQPSTLTGIDFKRGSLTGAHIKNGSVAAQSFTAATTSSLRVAGATGDTGPQGERGATGRTGTTGDRGTPAPRAFTFQTSTQSNRVKGATVNVGANEIAYLPNCEDTIALGDPMVGCSTIHHKPQRYPRWNYWCGAGSKHCNTTNISTPQLSRSLQTLVVTSENTSGGLLNMPYRGTIVLNASLTLFTQRTPINQRIECQLQVRRVENGDLGETIDVGVPMTVARRSGSHANQQDLLVNLALTGATAQAPGVFETQVACRAPDDTGRQGERLEFIEGNMSVLTTRTNGEA